MIGPAVVLLVEDNPADIRLTREAFREGGFAVRLEAVRDGEAAIRFLRRQGEHARAPRPHLILLDLNLPRRNGRQVLRDLKSCPELRSIPVAVLTTSEAEDDVRDCYDLHANCYISKPLDLERFIEIVRRLEHFWFTAVQLPEESGCTSIAPELR